MCDGLFVLLLLLLWHALVAFLSLCGRLDGDLVAGLDDGDDAAGDAVGDWWMPAGPVCCVERVPYAERVLFF